MTERKLWYGWNKPRAVKWFFIGYLVPYIFLWAKEVNVFDYYLFFSRVKSEYGITEECRWRWVNLTDLLQETNPLSMIGFVYALIFTASVAVTAVHRESFRHNWDLTLRRIPNYRGKYLISKIVAVLIPAVGYPVYYGAQWWYRFRMYQREIQRQYEFYKGKPEKIKYVPLEVKEFFGSVPVKPVLEMALYSVLAALALLLLSLTVRRIKKDVIGFCMAIAGLTVAVLLFSEVFAITRAVEIGMLSLCIGIILFFNIRHVYLKW